MNTEKKIMLSTIFVALVVSIAFTIAFLKEESFPETIKYEDTYDIYKFMSTQNFRGYW